ncbi:hypothetical protein BJX76DRAFT_356199 [Aspergillus varians]
MAKKKNSKISKNKKQEAMASAASFAIDYNQPDISHYEQSQIITVIIGVKNYSIPKKYIQGCKLWQKKDLGAAIILDDIDAGIGHTILHFLYKGEYETTTYSGIQSDTSRIEIEYRRSIQVYYAARKYELYTLQTLAQKYIETFSESLSIFQILRGVKMIFSKLSEDEKWFYAHLYSQILSSFEKDEAIFQLDEFYDEIADDLMLSKAVMKMVVGLFAVQLSRFRKPLEAIDNGSEVHKSPGKLDMDGKSKVSPEEPVFNGGPVEVPSVEEPPTSPYYEKAYPEPEPEPKPAADPYYEKPYPEPETVPSTNPFYN